MHEKIFSERELHADSNALTGQIMTALSNAVEAKDRYTNGHSLRVAKYSMDIARRMGLDSKQQHMVYHAGLLHDVGKIRVPDTIINKAGRLSDDEYAEMKLHTMAGYYILKEVSLVSDFAVGARWHHERYNGTGYPNGLSGENIPLIARVIGVADAYDAMTSNRSYRTLLPQTVVRQEIEKGIGTQFDPDVAHIMLNIIDEDAEYFMRQPDPNLPIKVLAIDDDGMALAFLKHTFSKMTDFKLLTVSDGETGLALFEKERPDVVLLDVEMPKMDGFAVLEAIRVRNTKTPVIFMTGDRDIGIIQRAEAMGISDYLTKPVVPHMLAESIRNVAPRLSGLGEWSDDND